MISGEERPFAEGITVETLESTGLDMQAIGAGVAERIKQLAEFTQKEFAAYELFRRLTRHMQRAPQCETEILTEDVDEQGYTKTCIYYPPIGHTINVDGMPSEYKVCLGEVRYAHSGKTVGITPFLGVYDANVVEEYGYDPEHADVYYARTPLDALCGYKDVSSFKDISSGLLAPESSGGGVSLTSLIEEQEGYIAWLGVCVEELRMGQQYVPLSGPDIIQQCGGLGFSLDS